jgi:cephalosporin hydroxylase
MDNFEQDVKERILSYKNNEELKNASLQFIQQATLPQYSYNFSWLGRPVIQYPPDIIGMQEIIWTVQPDLIIETGIARGGSLIFSASILALLDICNPPTSQSIERKVLGIDIDIRSHNRTAIESHPLANRITMIEGSSDDAKVIDQVKAVASNHKSILVCLDSNHTHDHVLHELEAYSPLVSVGSYCVVFDTIIDDLPEHMLGDRPWGPGNNPKTAVHQFLETNSHFKIDKDMHNKLQITVAPDGFLKRVR